MSTVSAPRRNRTSTSPLSAECSASELAAPHLVTLHAARTRRAPSTSAPDWIRTSNLLHVTEALRPLSYGRVQMCFTSRTKTERNQWADVELNHGPPACRAGALAAELQAQLLSSRLLETGFFFAGRNSRPTKAGSYERAIRTLRSDQRGMAAWPSLSDR